MKNLSLIFGFLLLVFAYSCSEEEDDNQFDQNKIIGTWFVTSPQADSYDMYYIFTQSEVTEKTIIFIDNQEVLLTNNYTWNGDGYTIHRINEDITNNIQTLNETTLVYTSSTDDFQTVYTLEKVE